MTLSSSPDSQSTESLNLTAEFTERMATLDGPEADTERLSEALLRDCCRVRGSDIHFQPMDEATRLRFRIDGQLIDAAMVPAPLGGRLVNHFKTLSEIEMGHLFTPHENRTTYTLDEKDLELRLALVPTIQGEALVIRVLHPEAIEQNIHELGFSEKDLDQLKQWMDLASGMLLVAGPTGGGKTTTIYGLMHELAELDRGLYTVEDPVEYQVDGINQVQVDSEHGLDFADGLRSLLRMDPDYVMMGEIRDGDGAQAAVTAALRGRVLMSTLHARDPFSVVSSLRHWGVDDSEIAVSMTLVIAQRLVRLLCPECRSEGTPTEDERRWLRVAGVEPPETLWRPGSCEACRGLGYRGRTGLFELWQPTEEDYQAILHGEDEHALRQRAHDRGYRTMIQDGMDKLSEGMISMEELRHTPDLLPRRMEPLSTWSAQ